jgi:oligoendopeptidase F
VKKDVFYARARKYDNCRAAALFADRVPESVYDALVETVGSRLSALTGYLDFRRDTLGLDELHIYDTYVPLVTDTDFSLPYEQAVNLCAEAMAPLGDEYVSILREGLLGGWVDRYENRGKRSGAYSSGCYDSPPYILLNYDAGNINSLYTLIHEAGHSMHSFLSNRSQPYVTHDYAIFVAEVASTFNETLLSHFLMSHYADNPAMQAYILNREIDNIRATLFRQTMFAEFETQVHAVAENHEPLTLDVFTDIYGRLLEKYFGNRMVIDPQLALECFRIPHFYSAFYVYKYATGISAAISLAQSVLSGEKSATEDYLAFLSLGGSRYPLDALSVAGVDMQHPDAVEHAVSRFEGLVDRLKGRVDS